LLFETQRLGYLYFTLALLNLPIHASAMHVLRFFSQSLCGMKILSVIVKMKINL
jgi:hypothetical protein